MAGITTVPVDVAPEAALRIQELGIQREFDHLLELTRERIPRLHLIEVTRGQDEADGSQGLLFFTAYYDGPQWEVSSPTYSNWHDSLIRAFPPAVIQWFNFAAWDWAGDGR
jgi:hypothetical protein